MGMDPETKRIIPLFHPRKDNWADHFAVRTGTLMPLGLEIRGLTPVGRVTVQVLGMNEEMRQMLRYELWLEALYVSQDPQE